MWLAIFGMILPSVSFGASPTAAVQDVALRSDRSLQGRVVDRDGNGHANIPVTIRQAGDVVGSTTTDQSGWFVMTDLKSGNYSLEAAENLVHCRAWSRHAAPPIACDPMICSEPIVCPCPTSHRHCRGHKRHQHRHGPLGGHAGPLAVHAVGGAASAVGSLLSSPLGLAVVASAIAIPLTVDDDDNAS